MRISILPILYLGYFLISCTGGSSQESIKFKQYFQKGEQLYNENCSNCHQKDGSGLALLYPPLDSSDYLANPTDLYCIIRLGKSGELIVNGMNFNQPMPAFPGLSDLEIAEISTFILNSWSNKQGLHDVKDVSIRLETCVNN
jgi:cytochrome c551